MKLLTIFFIFSLLIFANSLYVRNYSSNLRKFSAYICNVAHEELQKDQNIKNVIIAQHKNNFPSHFINYVVKCLPTFVQKFIFEAKGEEKQAETFTASTLVLCFACPGPIGGSLVGTGDQLLLDERVSLHAKYVVILDDGTQANEVVEVFHNEFTYNFFVTWMEGPEIKFIIPNKFIGNEETSKQDKTVEFFPDKLKNLNGYVVQVKYIETIVPHPMLNFLDVLGEKINATIKKGPEIDLSIEHAMIFIIENIGDQSLGVIGTAYYLQSIANHILSFDVQELCFQVEEPDLIAIYELILIRPLDLSSWIFLTTTLLTCAVIWRMFKNYGAVDSCWDFLFSSVAFFLGQSTSIRTRRFVLILLMQILIFALFIFGNGYQSFVTSFLLNPLVDPRFEKVDDLLDSDDVPYIQYQGLQSLMDPNLTTNFDARFTKIYEKSNILNVDPTIGIRLTEIRGCKELDEKSKWVKTTECDKARGYKGFYKVPEVIGSQQVVYDVGPGNPLAVRMQEILQRCFEGGFNHFWDLLVREKILGPTPIDECYVDPKEILDLESIFPIFIVLFICNLISFFGLLMEIFHHDFLVPYAKYYKDEKARRRKELDKRRIRKIRRNPKTKIIKVKPKC